MAEMVGSAVVQEAVSGAFSYVVSNHEELVSQSRLLERLKMAHLQLKFALERSRRMPIAEVSLLQRRMMIKLAFEDSRDVLLRANLEEQRVSPLSLSLPKRIMHVVKPFFSTGKCSISASCVRRFEWFAEKADKFVRDVESGCSLARYRFSSPLITQLLQGKYVYCKMLSGSQTGTLLIVPTFLEDYGAVACLEFELKDLEAPMKWCRLILMLRLSESTDIVGISTSCLQSLETTQFKPMADVASGELAQISTQVGFSPLEPREREHWVSLLTDAYRLDHQEPLCCIGDGFQPLAKNIHSSELGERFPEQVSRLGFECFVSSNLQSSVETNRSTIMACPVLQLSVDFQPHRSVVCGPFDSYIGFSKAAEFVQLQAVDRFNLEPQRTEYTMDWFSEHGCAIFTVSKPTAEMGCAPQVGEGSKTRRVSKRKR